MLFVLFPGGIRGDDRAGVDLEIIPDPKHRRLKATVDIALAVKLYYTSQCVYFLCCSYAVLLKLSNVNLLFILVHSRQLLA